MKDRALARLVSVAALALVALAFLAGDAHAVAYPCSKAGLHQGLTAGGVITLSCAQPTTIALTEGGNYLQPIDFDGEGRVTITNAGLFGIVTRAQATFKRTTFAGAAPGGRGVIIQSTAPITFDRVIIRDITPGDTGGTLFITTCATACTSRVIDSTITNVIDGVFEVSGSATLEVTNTTFDGVYTPFWTLDAGQVRARYVTIARGSFVGRQFNNGNIRFTGSIIDTSSWLMGNGTTTSGGHNVIQGGVPAGFATATDVVVAAPLTLGLQSLAANGGPTPTVALDACSAAINAVTDNGAPSTDQRGTGFPRVNQGKPDAGAFESNHTATPCIAEQPTDRTIFATQTLTLSVAASGPANRTYQWKKGANNIPGATSATYTKNNAVVGDAGTYSVVVTGPGGSTTSNNATVVVHGPPTFTTHPQNRNLAAGATLTLTAAASGQSVTYQWKKGANNIGGATSANYTKTNTVVADSGNYTVVATNPAGSVTSNVATVTVTNPPNITAQPQARTIFATQTLTLSVVASDATSYQWKKGANNIPGATSATYTKANAVVADAGTYSVVVTGPGGSTTSNNATVVVHGPPAFTTHPQNRNLAAGATLTLTAAASGESVTYQWKKGANNIGGATNATYTKANAVVADSGNYTVVATNPAGSVTSNVATVTVTNPPNITTQPQARTIFATQTLTLSVVASDATSYQWKKGANDISGATSATYTKNNAVVGDAGTYSVVVTGPGGSTTSNNATVVVHGPPAFTTHPQNRDLAAGATLTLTAAASGQSVTYQWKKGANDLSGATNATYTKANAAVADSGNYTVVATNPAGSVTSNVATVTVTNPPNITTQPQARTIFATQTLTLSVVASDATSYQWKKGANDIPGATSATYTKNNAVVGDAGTYSVVVTGPGGSTTSNNATVVVHGPPSISAEPQDLRAFLGQAVTVAVTAQGEGLGYQWHFGTGPIAGATSASYEFVANEANAGAYSVVVSNPAGSATSRSATVTIDGRPVITVDPEDVTLFAGQTLSLDIQAEGVGLSYQWQLEGADIDGATAATYTKVADVADTGSYVALVRNGAGEVASTPAAVVVHGPPVIVTPPSAASVFGSTELTLSVVASGESLSYQWRKDEVEIEDATEATYRVTATSELAGQYDVVVTNPAGSVTADAVAVVVYGPPLIVTPPSGLTARAGDLVSLTVVATGEALTYKWYRDELEVPDATLSTLSFTASEANAGDYIVAVSNPAGTVESEPVTVSLEDEPEPEPEPEVEAEPGPELDLEPTPEAAEVETVTKGRSEDGCAGGPTGVFAWLFGLALVLGRRRH